MRLETRTGLDDLLRASELVQSAISGMTIDQFLGNWEKQSAVERQFMIIGEALIRIRSHEPSVFESIPDSKAIVGFRNILAHGYDIADPEAIFEIAGDKLTELREFVTQLISENPAS